MKVDFGWGAEDLARVADTADAIVIVDTLRFTSAVSVAVSRGAVILPYRWRDDTVTHHALAHDAEVGGSRENPTTPWSLSPTDLAEIPAGTRVVLPSPNGATLSVLAGESGARAVLAGCLRNRTAVARALTAMAGEVRTVAVIAAGERWPDEEGEHTGPMRPAFEDLIGAGAVIDALLDVAGATSSPEARGARDAFLGAAPTLLEDLRSCMSGVELIARGWDDDVQMCAQLDVDLDAPIFDGVAFRRN